MLWPSLAWRLAGLGGATGWPCLCENLVAADPFYLRAILPQYCPLDSTESQSSRLTFLYQMPNWLWLHLPLLIFLSTPVCNNLAKMRIPSLLLPSSSHKELFLDSSMRYCFPAGTPILQLIVMVLLHPSQNISSFENVTFVRSSATHFTYIWQTLDDLSSPILRSALRILLYPQLPGSRASCPFLRAPRAPSENSVYFIVICCLWSICPDKGEYCICLCHPLSRIGPPAVLGH